MVIRIINTPAATKKLPVPIQIKADARKNHMPSDNLTRILLTRPSYCRIRLWLINVPPSCSSTVGRHWQLAPPSVRSCSSSSDSG